MTKLGAIEAAELMAAAAVAEMAEMRTQLETVKCNSRRLNSEHSKRTYRVKKDLLDVRLPIVGAGVRTGSREGSICPMNEPLRSQRAQTPIPAEPLSQPRC